MVLPDGSFSQNNYGGTFEVTVPGADEDKAECLESLEKPLTRPIEGKSSPSQRLKKKGPGKSRAQAL
jgi:hypothetical protein